MSLLQKTQTEELLGRLNEVQKDAVLHKEGPMLILAGAGSGKTRVITHRIAYLIMEHGTKPWNIAALTFTNKAAEEMRERLAQLLGALSRHVFMRTFHSLGVYILSRHPENLGLDAGFSIVDQAAQNTLLKRILAEEKWEQNFLSPKSLAAQINGARDAMLSPEALACSGISYAEETARIYKLYIKRLRKNNSLDFGDLLYESVRLFQAKPELQKRYSSLWQYFMIDEYQDTNKAQYKLGSLIAGGHSNIMVVGDDDQSIYSWRGADISNILHFEKDYENTKVLKLEENYRSNPSILKAASSLISHNQERRAKTLYTKKETDKPLSLDTYDDETKEAQGIIERISNYNRRDEIAFHEMAVFYRTNAQSRILERSLRERNVPYIIVGDIRFYERKEIKDLLAYLKVIANPGDDTSLERIINVPARGLGDKTLDVLRALSLAKAQSLLASLAHPEELSHLRSHQKEKMRRLYANFTSWAKLLEAKLLPSKIARQVLHESGYLAALQAEESYEAQGRIENLYELIASIEEYERECMEEGTNAYSPGRQGEPWDFQIEDASESPEANLIDFLQRISLYTDESKRESHEEDCVYLMTLHNAKGLEFRCVFLCGFEEKFLPHVFSIDDGTVEEERRLLYVGITRAKEHLHLSHALQRWHFGSLEMRQISRFFEEIDSSVFANAPGKAKAAKEQVTEEKAHCLTKYQAGERVQHSRYGQGRITKAEALLVGQKLYIRFENEKRERLFLSQYTPLVKLTAPSAKGAK